MINITDKSHKPELQEINEYIGNQLFGELYEYLLVEYKALYSVEYSGDNLLPGWNVKFYKAGRTLCRLYPKPGYFTVLLVVGRKEKERTAALLPQLSDSVRKIYQNTPEGMGQRWLLIDLQSHDASFDDLLKLIRIRRESK